MLLFDGHLDLSMNALEWNRDLTRPLAEVRRREEGKSDKKDRGRGVCTFPEMRRGQIGLCIATQIARYVAPDNPLPGWHAPEIAWAQTQGQLAWYRAMEERGKMVQIRDRAALARHVTLWQNDPPADAPIGYILSLEGADSIVELGYLEWAYASGLRAIGPAHYGPGRYSPGTGAEGGLTAAGRDLVKEMRRLGIVLDVTHLTDEAFWEALGIYDGPVWASHNNCRALVPHQRQFNDEQLKELIRRDAVIGAAFDAWMMVPGWIRGKTQPQDTGVTIETIVEHIDHICQLAGSARHCAIGSDLDGGYGTEQTPMDLASIADLQRLNEILARRGYSAGDITGIMHGNWIRKLSEALPGVSNRHTPCAACLETLKTTARGACLLLMKLAKYRLASGHVGVGRVEGDHLLPLDLSGGQYRSLFEILESDNPYEAVEFLAREEQPIKLEDVMLLPPIDDQEVWAAGVTYKRSRTARMEESAAAASCYDRVYASPRPELFFKASPHRVSGHGQPLRIRADSNWNVPEPELTLVLSSQLNLVGFTVGNDMSSRDIEGDNPLYLPQAKCYNQSCGLGPWITLAVGMPPRHEIGIRLLIHRGGQILFDGKTSVEHMARTFENLIGWLGRDNSFPTGAFLLTGTGIVPESQFTLEAKDIVEIKIDGIGTLLNPIVQG